MSLLLNLVKLYTIVKLNITYSVDLGREEMLRTFRSVLQIESVNTHTRSRTK